MSHSGGDGNIPQLYAIFHGEVASLQAYGAFVKIPGCKKQGLVHKSQMSSAHIEDPSEMLAKGEKVYCKVIGFEGEGEKISLSMKVVNQTTGADQDPNNVQMDQDAKKRRQWKHVGKERIELGAELNTTCRRCGGHGHLTIDCFSGKDGTQYDLIPDIETLTALPPVPDRQHKKKKKKEKKKKKKSKKKKHSSSSSSSSSSDENDDKGSNGDKNKFKHHPHREENCKGLLKDEDLRKRRKTSEKHGRSRSSSRSVERNVPGKKRGRARNSNIQSERSMSPPQRRQNKDDTTEKERSYRDKSQAQSQERVSAGHNRFRRKSSCDRESSSDSSNNISPQKLNADKAAPQDNRKSNRQDLSPRRRSRNSERGHYSVSDNTAPHKQTFKRSEDHKGKSRHDCSPHRGHRSKAGDEGGNGNWSDLHYNKQTSSRKRECRGRKSRSLEGHSSGSENSPSPKRAYYKSSDRKIINQKHREQRPRDREERHSSSSDSSSHKLAHRKMGDGKKRNKQYSSPRRHSRSRSSSSNREYKSKKKHRSRSSS